MEFSNEAKRAVNQGNRATYIYVLIDPRDGEIRYVGKTVFMLEDRLNKHLRDKHNNYRTRWIQSLVRQGLKPIIKLIETVPPDEDWAERERYWIAYYRSIGANLTNFTDGGEGVPGWIPLKETRRRMSNGQRNRKPITQITRQKLSIANKGRKSPMIGKRHSNASKEKMCQAHLGKKHSPETREKVRQARLGKPLSFEHREKLAQAKLGKEQSPEHIEKSRRGRMKPVVQYMMDGKTLVRVWESAKTAGEALGIRSSHISTCCLSKQKSTGGFIWRHRLNKSLEVE